MSDDDKDKTKELLELIASIDLKSPSSVRYELFEFVRTNWAAFTEAAAIKTAICRQLELSSAVFDMMLMNPEMAWGTEALHRNVKPGWLRDYLDYTTGHEAPEDFHLWVGLTVISAALRRKVYLDNVYHKLYPNLFTILVSPPGVGKKTTAINIGVNILREAVPECKIVSEKCTPEALAKRLAKAVDKVKDSGGLKMEVRAEGMIVAPELTVFMGGEQYNASLITLLTRLYDCADIQETETIARGVEKLKNVFVSMLGATTPTEFSRAIPAAATGGGLMSRLTIIQKDSTPRIVPFAASVDPTMRENLVNGLRKIDTEWEGPLTYTKEGRKWYIDYYKHHHKVMERVSAGGNVERQPDHVIKVAVCLRAAEGGSMELDDDVLQRAFNIISAATKNCGDIVKMVDSSERGRLAQYVVDLIKRNGGIMDRTTLMKRVWRQMNAQDLCHVLDTLTTAGVLVLTEYEKRRFVKLTSFEE